MRPCTRGIALVLSLLLSLPGTLLAQSTERQVEIRGFGGWAYGRTNQNSYRSGTPEGNYLNANLALNVTAQVSHRLTIIGQIEGVESAEEETEFELDYAFAQWNVSDALKLRVGKVKQPFGIYTELFDVGTVRPFQDLPAALYGNVGFMAEGFNGVGLRGSHRLGGAWSVGYDAYAGGIGLVEREAPLLFLEGEPVEDEVFERGRDVVGARAVVQLPLAGLSLGASGFSARLDSDDESVRRTAVAAQLSYTSERIWWRNEYARADESGEHTRGGYSELAYFLTPTWQPAVRYERLDTRIDGLDASVAPSLLDHQSWRIGINLWPEPDLVLRASVEFVRGNRLAAPEAEALADVIAAGDLRRTTRLFQVGAQFSF